MADRPKRAQKLLKLTEDTLMAQMKLAAERTKNLKPGSWDEDLTTTIANLSRAVQGLAAEKRQQEKAVKSAVKDMTAEEFHALICDYLANDATEDAKAEYRRVLGVHLRSVL